MIWTINDCDSTNSHAIRGFSEIRPTILNVIFNNIWIRVITLPLVNPLGFCVEAKQVMRRTAKT